MTDKTEVRESHAPVMRSVPSRAEYGSDLIVDLFKAYVGAHDMGGGVGYGIGHSVGAALALGKTQLCVDIQPDGDLLYTPSALWTAAHHRIPLLIVMYNSMDNPPVDFAGMAKSFGIESWGPIEEPGEIRPALERAVRYVLKERKAALVDVFTQFR